MAKRKSVSFDAMVKFFMQNYGIPTKKDVEKLMARIDRLEALIKSSTVQVGRGQVVKREASVGKKGRAATGMTASDTVLAIIKRSRNGVGFETIQKKTGYNEKKLRNIIFRLNKLGRITRKERGIYLAA